MKKPEDKSSRGAGTTDSRNMRHTDQEDFILSPTIQDIVLSDEGAPITAMEFAERILKKHPEYFRRGEQLL